MSIRAVTEWVLGIVLCGGLSFGFSGCGQDDPTCISDRDCTSGQSCLWVKKNGQVVGERCVTKCKDDTACQPKLCDGESSSCATCKDFIPVCGQ